MKQFFYLHCRDAENPHVLLPFPLPQTMFTSRKFRDSLYRMLENTDCRITMEYEQYPAIQIPYRDPKTNSYTDISPYILQIESVVRDGCNIHSINGIEFQYILSFDKLEQFITLLRLVTQDAIVVKFGTGQEEFNLQSFKDWNGDSDEDSEPYCPVEEPSDNTPYEDPPTPPSEFVKKERKVKS